MTNGPLKEAIPDPTPIIVEKKSRYNFKLIGGIVAGIIVGVVATLIIKELVSDDPSTIVEAVTKSLENTNVGDVISK